VHLSTQMFTEASPMCRHVQISLQPSHKLFAANVLSSKVWWKLFQTGRADMQQLRGPYHLVLVICLITVMCTSKPGPHIYTPTGATGQWQWWW